MAFAEATVQTKKIVTAVDITLTPLEAVTLGRLLYCHVAGPCGPGTLRGELDNISVALCSALSVDPELLDDSQKRFGGLDAVRYTVTVK